MNASLASAITRAASTQTYYTIRFLVDRPRVEDAYRAYAYFRWVDDVLDADGPSGPAQINAARGERVRFFDRQNALLDQCLRGEAPREANAHETMLVELVRHAGDDNTGLYAYLRNMMRVMEFDVGRRGRLVSQAELDGYTRWLAIAVTENLHHFIGHGARTPHDATRYLAVSGAHIAHMLRDTYDDLRLGYYNVPREVLGAGHIGPQDVQSDAYRAWVRSRVQLARAHFDAGRAYFARGQSARHRLAGLAYIARFEWLLETLEREDFRLRPRYGERKRVGSALRMGRLVFSSLLGARDGAPPARPIAAPQEGSA